MVDTMAVLGAAASAKLTGDRIVRDFVAYIRETTTSMTSGSSKYTTRAARPKRRKGARLSRRMKPSTGSLGRRPSRLSRKVSTMTDAELEAELDTRRRRRAKEREVYSRAMRSDKLAALESELASLRHELGRIDTPSTSKARFGAGTPPSARWEPLPRNRSSPGDNKSVTHMAAMDHNQIMPSTPVPMSTPRRGGPPPPPPPPMPKRLGDDGDDAELSMDPEKQKREKEERQKRREAKKKEREQTQKKMTLADIIRSAGADPAKRLKPASKKPADVEKEEWERAKKEREEREQREEQERIEQEQLAMKGLSKRVSEKKSDDEEEEAEEGKKNEETKEEGAEEKKEGEQKKISSENKKEDEGKEKPSSPENKTSTDDNKDVTDDKKTPNKCEEEKENIKEQKEKVQSETQKLVKKTPESSQEGTDEVKENIPDVITTRKENEGTEMSPTEKKTEDQKLEQGEEVEIEEKMKTKDPNNQETRA